MCTTKCWLISTRRDAGNGQNVPLAAATLPAYKMIKGCAGTFATGVHSLWNILCKSTSEEVEHPVRVFFLFFFCTTWPFLVSSESHTDAVTHTPPHAARQKNRLSNFRRRATSRPYTLGFFFFPHLSKNEWSRPRGLLLLPHVSVFNFHGDADQTFFIPYFSRVCRCHQLKTKSATAGRVKTARFWT